ncbi:hypothetical protein GXW71_27135 [Roseomonas hellenica]|uniref:Uncharacterized protein n=1 Tax=Plastoroseomonas hellenica TaxID=2687306 RepID=A0ABS5F671_9PROT|nr:hypothetical protein [Plastoroseomonas hellenica]MBR0668058.1 hypothetical protein [Plastoroseomonas hellenica]
MEPTRLATTTLWAALAFTWLAASSPPPKEPGEAPRAASAERDGVGREAKPA